MSNDQASMALEDLRARFSAIKDTFQNTPNTIFKLGVGPIVNPALLELIPPLEDLIYSAMYMSEFDDDDYANLASEILELINIITIVLRYL